MKSLWLVVGALLVGCGSSASAVPNETASTPDDAGADSQVSTDAAKDTALDATEELYQDKICQPGRQVACTCTTGADGSQTCSEDGFRWEQCVCTKPKPDAAPDVENDVVDSSPIDSDQPEADASADAGCQAPSRLCSGICVNPSVDQENCGACGYSCQGNACVKGACKPSVFAKERANSIATDNQFVYWMSQESGNLGKIRRAPAVGDEPFTLYDKLPHTGNLAVWKGALIWTDPYTSPGAITQMSTTGGEVSVFASVKFNLFDVVPAQDKLFFSAVSAHSLFWSSQPNSPQEFNLCDTGLGNVTVSGEYVYWAEKSGIKRKSHTQAGKVETVAVVSIDLSSSSPDGGIAVTAGYVYFGAWVEKRLYRASITTGKVETVQDSVDVHHVTGDDKNVYWTVWGKDFVSVVYQYNHDLNHPTVVASEQYAPQAFALGSKYVYWSTDKEIVRVGR